MINSIIFDLDGVLTDTEAISCKTTKMVLKELGIEETDEEYMAGFGARFADSLANIAKKRAIKVDLAAAVMRKDELFIAYGKGKIKALPGAKRFLKKAIDSGYKVAVASSGEDKRVHFVLEEIGIRHLFKTIITAKDVKKGKPDPAVFLKAAKGMGSKPEDCVVIEDTDVGINAAKNAGMKCIGVRSPHTFGQNLKKADFVSDGLGKLDISIIKAL